MKYIGCSASEFKKYIENLFEDGMTWNNHGHYIDDDGVKQIGWHLDHKIPCIAFDLTNEDEVCWYYKNFQPLWGIENCSKSGYYNIM